MTLIIAIVISVAVGFLNGIIIYDFRVPPMIATLGMQTIVRGLVKIISNALTVTGIDQRILSMGNTNLFWRTSGVSCYLGNCCNCDLVHA